MEKNYVIGSTVDFKLSGWQGKITSIRLDSKKNGDCYGEFEIGFHLEPHNYPPMIGAEESIRVHYPHDLGGFELTGVVNGIGFSGDCRGDTVYHGKLTIALTRPALIHSPKKD